MLGDKYLVTNIYIAKLNVKRSTKNIWNSIDKDVWN